MFSARALAIPLNCQHFLKFLTMQILPLSTKKVKNILKKTSDQLAFSQIYQKYLENVSLNKSRNFLRIYFRNISVGFRRV